jgi:hypothetical protein
VEVAAIALALARGVRRSPPRHPVAGAARDAVPSGPIPRAGGRRRRVARGCAGEIRRRRRGTAAARGRDAEAAAGE